MAIYELDGVAPQIDETAWVADSAEVMGRVTLEKAPAPFVKPPLEEEKHGEEPAGTLAGTDAD